jgi:formylglycine-generating enzyme required for sulfatase activity
MMNFETVRVNEQGEVIATIPGKAACFTEDLGNSVMLEMVRIPGGKFRMGTAANELGGGDDRPQHEVTVPEFWLGKYTVTQSQWQAVVSRGDRTLWQAIASLGQKKYSLDLNPGYFKGPQRPIEQVSWEDAIEFCSRLSRGSPRKYTLPSEAQWEYACRAGTTTRFSFGPTLTTDLANYDSLRGETTDVGVFKPNAFGLYDMHGNVHEWCLDGWHYTYHGAPADGSAWKSSEWKKVLRGGAWISDLSYCDAAGRGYNEETYSNNCIGFRVCCTGS